MASLEQVLREDRLRGVDVVPIQSEVVTLSIVQPVSPASPRRAPMHRPLPLSVLVDD
jgi:hypothetical protein